MEMVQIHIQEMTSLTHDIMSEPDSDVAKKKRNIIFETINFFKKKIANIDNEDNTNSCSNFTDEYDFYYSDSDKRSNSRNSNNSDNSDSTCYLRVDSEQDFEMDESYKKKLNDTMANAVIEFNQHQERFFKIKKINEDKR